MAQSNKKTSAPQRIMIIIWKWKKSIVENDEKWRTNHKPQTADCIYCLSDGTSFPEHFKKVCKIASECAPNAHIYIFWHRTSSYNSESVGGILRKLKADQPEQKAECFIFGSGSDFIYIGINEKGLLSSDGAGGEGCFGGIRNNEEIKVVVNEEQRIIDYLHFESIWNYYSHLFKSRIFDLKEDFLLHFYCWWLKDETVNPLRLAGSLDTSKGLYRRLKAFAHGLSEEDHLKIKSEIAEAKEQNDENKITELSKHHSDLYVMDNCLPNLQSIYGTEVANAYLRLAELIKENIIYVPMRSDKQIRPSETLKEIRSQFKNLLHTMPEEAYY